MASTDLVLRETVRDVAIIRFNDPTTLNSLSQELTQATIDALNAASKDARAILLTGAGRGFCAGANLAASGVNPEDPERDMGAALDTVFNPLIRTMRDLPVPLVTAVKGPAAGIGCSIALMGDIIIAAKSAYFLQAFCNIALIPDGGSAYLLARTIGRVKAMEMMMLGERYPAETAMKDGLVTRLVDDEELDAVSLEYAERLAKGPTKSLGLIRKSAWAALDATLDEQLCNERIWQREAGRTEDLVEGVTAFFQKRETKFQGK